MIIKSAKVQRVNNILATIAVLVGVSMVQGLPQSVQKKDEYLRCLEQYNKDFGNTHLFSHEFKSLCKMQVSEKLTQVHPQEPMDYFHSLHRVAWSDMNAARKKRFTSRRIRKEIRSLSMDERRALFRAINDLKQDTSVYPNVYDAFANLHTGKTLRSAYHGPNFLGWNRYYLYLFETALRTKDPTVVLPYWDSTLDFNMNDPSHTVMFSSEFMGNVDHTGALESGPFMNWGIIRDIGQVGSFMSEELLESILRNPQTLHHDQIVENGPGASVHTIEGQQNNVHAWVGGRMADRKSAPKDPIFFFHRCFVDLVWELFREKQILHGVDPETDYPNMGGVFHDPDRHMDGFPWVKNIDGYSNNFTDLMFRYDDRNQCPICHGSRYLNCVRDKCRSVSTMIFNEAPMAAVVADMNVVNSHIRKFKGPLIMENMYEVTFNDTRIRGHPRHVIIVRNPSDPYLLSEGVVAAASAQIAATEEVHFNSKMKEPSTKNNFVKVNKDSRPKNNLEKVSKEPSTKSKLEKVDKVIHPSIYESGSTIVEVTEPQSTKQKISFSELKSGNNNEGKSQTYKELIVNNSRNITDTSPLPQSTTVLTTTQPIVPKKVPSKKTINTHFKEVNIANAHSPSDQIFLSGGIVAPSSAKIAMQQNSPSRVPVRGAGVDVNSVKDSFDITSSGLSQPNFIGRGNVIV